METHEEKRCPRCQLPFICRMGNIGHCQCSNVALSTETSDLLKKIFPDCLCQSCLIELNLVIKNGQQRDA